MNNKISVIVPIYNVEQYLEVCLSSILNQTYKNFEVICVNDGTKDNSVKIVEDFQKKDSRVFLFNKENGGLSSARNLGLQKATGDYVCFLDSDDLMDKNFLETMFHYITKHNADMVSCSYFKFADGKKFKWAKNKKINEEILPPKEFLTRAFAGRSLQGCVAWAKLYKKSAITFNFFEQVKYGEDMPFNYFCSKFMDKIVWIDAKLIAYRQRKNSLIHQAFNTNKLTAFIGEELIVADCETWDKSLVPLAKLWLYFQHFEILYFMFRSKFANFEIVKKSISYLKNNLLLLTKNKKASLFRRVFAPLGQSLLIGFSKKMIKQKRTKKQKTA